jgi:DNA-3-methyladenine glycosylase II
VRGIGEWTAHMFLISQLGRLDVWPTLDLGVRMGYARLFELAEPPTSRELAPLGDPFHPYRSLVASWCWRAVDTIVPD